MQLSTLLIGTTIYWKVFAASSVTAPFLALYVIKKWTDDNYTNHPIVANLRKCCNNNNNWEAVASDIETEYRRFLVWLKLERDEIHF